jgi:Cu(I)/Ag(I) efflux system membrane fusion protein
MNVSKTVIFVAFATLVIGATAGYWLGARTAVSESGVTANEQRDREPLFYRNKMNPSVTSPVPAKDSMGMDYEPVYATDNSTSVPGLVQIDPVIVQNIGVRTTTAERRVLNRVVRALGRIDMDEELVARVHPKVEGWVEVLQVDKTGDLVSKGDVLLSVYSPQLVTTQEEYVIAARALRAARENGSPVAISSAESVIASVRERLLLLDVPPHQIDALAKTQKVLRNLHIHSPFNGVVMRIGARQGQYVSPNTELFMLADLSKVWVYVDIYEYELPWIGEGDVAEMRVVAVPGRIFEGAITYIYPYMEQSTRTVKVRLEFDNSEGLLKPEMFATVNIEAQRQIDAIVVPTEAVVRSGNREQIFVVVGAGRFEPRDVVLGVSTDGLTQVLSGVDAGEEVVTSSQFLIDSESKLREATAKMLEGRKTAAPRLQEDVEEMQLPDDSPQDPPQR